MFITENLYTPDGGFVAEVKLPEFRTKPEVLIWGARVFLHVDSFVDASGNIGNNFEEGCYVEAFGYHIPPETHYSTREGGLEKELPLAPDHYEAKHRAEVYSNPNCLYHYCPNPETCKASELGCINIPV